MIIIRLLLVKVSRMLYKGDYRDSKNGIWWALLQTWSIAAKVRPMRHFDIHRIAVILS